MKTKKKPVRATTIMKDSFRYAVNRALLVTKAIAKDLNSTKVEVGTMVFTYPFYARIKTGKGKQFYPILYGNNNEIVFTGELHKNKNDVVSLLKMWFPQIVIKK